MGVEAQSSNNHRHRTIWTPEMDRYFIDLMLEQVGKENRRDDHLFSKRAWKHMTTMFNAKFNSRYQKDVLKNRHKMLRNLYRALKNLLEQKGFRWDESRQMVAADKRVWDEYVQAHPNARPYRAKTIPYYSDLCEIYGFGVKGTIFSRQKANFSEEEEEKVLHANVLSYSPNLGDDMVGAVRVSETATESLHDITIDETYQFLSDIGSTSGEQRTRTYWQPPMDRYFIDLMIDQVKKGNHVDGLLRKQAWREMISSFNAKFGFDYGVDILKNRYKTLRRQHKVIKSILELDGFGWDDARKMVIADDCVWQNYIKAHTDARQYMTRPLPYFEDMCLIFRELNGDEKDTDTTSIHRNDEGPEIKFATVDQFYKENESPHSDFETTKRQIEIPPTTRPFKKPRIEREDENSNVIPVELVVAAIQALPDMDEELVLDACDYLEDEKKAKTFLALDVKLRKKWLMRKLRPSQ